MMERDEEKQQQPQYPIGRGYGHDYMRGGEVFGGYGYSARDEYERRRGDATASPPGSAADGRSKMDAPGRGQPESRDPITFS